MVTRDGGLTTSLGGGWSSRLLGSTSSKTARPLASSWTWARRSATCCAMTTWRSAISLHFGQTQIRYGQYRLWPRTATLRLWFRHRAHWGLRVVAEVVVDEVVLAEVAEEVEDAPGSLLGTFPGPSAGARDSMRIISLAGRPGNSLVSGGRGTQTPIWLRLRRRQHRTSARLALAGGSRAARPRRRSADKVQIARSKAPSAAGCTLS